MTARVTQLREGEYAGTYEGERRHANQVGLTLRTYVFWTACPNCGEFRWLTPQRVRAQAWCNRCSIRLRTQPLGAEGARHKTHDPGAKQVGPMNHAWTGGRIMTAGYISVWLDKADPYFCMVQKSSKGGRAGYVMEHRLVMARAIGRPLERWEEVHHRNGDKSDNRIENLELWFKSHPAGQRITDVVCSHCPYLTLPKDQTND